MMLTLLRSLVLVNLFLILIFRVKSLTLDQALDCYSASEGKSDEYG